jgi:hypothetical protein
MSSKYDYDEDDETAVDDDDDNVDNNLEHTA